MNTKKIKKKLVLNKEKIAKLDNMLLTGIKGGISSPTICDSCLTCGGTNCGCPTGSTCVTCDTDQPDCTKRPTCYC